MEARTPSLTFMPDLARPETVGTIVSESGKLVDRLALSMSSQFFFVKPGKVLPYGSVFSVDRGVLVLPAIMQVMRQDESGRVFLGGFELSLKGDMAMVRNMVSTRLGIPLANVDVVVWAPHFGGRVDNVSTEISYTHFVGVVEDRMRSFRQAMPEVRDRLVSISRNLSSGRKPTAPPAAPATASLPVPPKADAPVPAIALGGLRLPSAPAARKALADFVSSLAEATQASGAPVTSEELKGIAGTLADGGEGKVVLRGNLDGIDPRYDRLRRPLAAPSVDLSADEAWTALSSEFPWMAEANVEVAREVAMSRAGSRPFRMQPILLLGRPGVGKTRYARRVAEILGLPFASVSCAGMNSSMAIRGSERGYTGARPSLPVGVMLSTETYNPMILLDELDKATGDANGHPQHALLSFLEPETAAGYRDECLMADIDCSGILWIMTANDATTIPAPLLSRVKSIHVGAPDASHLDLLVRLVAREVGASLGMSPEEAVRKAGMGELRQRFGKALDMRELRKEVSARLAEAIWTPPTADIKPAAEATGTVVPFARS